MPDRGEPVDDWNSILMTCYPGMSPKKMEEVVRWKLASWEECPKVGPVTCLCDHHYFVLATGMYAGHKFVQWKFEDSNNGVGAKKAFQAYCDLNFGRKVKNDESEIPWYIPAEVKIDFEALLKE